MFLQLSAEDYGNFLEFLPRMLLPNTRVTVLNPESGRNLFKTSVVSVPGAMAMLEQDREPETLPESLLPIYVRFLMCSPLSKEQLLREKMTPGTMLGLLYSSGLSDAEVVRTVGTFIQRNKCHLPHCPHFSRLRCEGCHVVHYCDTKCQVGLL